MIHRDIILNLDVLANGNTCVHVYTFTDDAFFANCHIFTHLCLMPDAGSLPYGSFVRDISGGMDTHSHIFSLSKMYSKKIIQQTASGYVNDAIRAAFENRDVILSF